METAKYQSKHSLKRPPPPIGFSIESPFTFGRFSVGITLASCWLRVNPSSAPHRPPSASRLIRAASTSASRRIRVETAENMLRKIVARRLSSERHQEPTLPSDGSGRTGHLRFPARGRCVRGPHPHADALAAKRSRFTASAQGCPAPPSTASRCRRRQRGSQASARTC